MGSKYSEISLTKDGSTDVKTNGRKKSHMEFSTLPEKIYGNLPVSLRGVTDLIVDAVERDLFLTGALPVLGGMLPKTLFKYGKQWQCVNLYMTVIAPSGAGKGAIRVAKRLGDVLNDRLYEESLRKMAEFETARTEAFIAGGEEATAGMEKPKFKRFYVAEDTSSSQIKHTLWDIPHGVIFATEAKSLAQALSSDWGNFRDVLLKAYHNEPIQVERRNTIPILIRRPAISMCITGTPGSFEGILSDTEDGLFSRMMFYYFDDPDLSFKSMFETEEELEMDSKIDMLAIELPALYEIMQMREQPLYLVLYPEDQARIVSAGRRAMKIVLSSGDVNLNASVKRAALNAYRIAGILTVVDRFFSGEDIAEVLSIHCTPKYVSTALTLAFSYLEHSVRLSEAMQEGIEGIATARMKLFGQIPTGESTTETIEQIYRGIGLTKASAFRYLDWFIERGQLERRQRGLYYKPDQNHDYSVLQNLAEEVVEDES